MSPLTTETSPRRLARFGGGLYLGVIVLGVSGEAFIRGPLVVADDAAATAANLTAMESVWRLGIASQLALLVCATALLPVLYVLLRPAGRVLALAAAAFDGVSLAVEAAVSLNLANALLPLGDGPGLNAWDPAQRHALVALALQSHEYGYAVALLFFGVFCLIVGRLIFVSGYLPRALGVLMGLAGGSYLVNTLALVLSPPLASYLFPAVLLPALVGEASFALWLVVRGVDGESWARRASALEA